MGEFNGAPVIAPKTLPGDVIRAKLTPEREGRLIARDIEILTPSPTRASAPCPHFSACGGCALQMMAPADYRAFKTDGLRASLHKAGFPESSAEVHFLPAASRRRVEFKVVKHDKKVQLALAAPRSHALVPISQCLILTPRLQRLLAPLARALEALSGVRPEAVSLTEANNSAVDVLLHYGMKPVLSVAQAEALMHDIGAARVSVEAGKRVSVLCKAAEVEIACGDVAVAVPPDGFLQAAADGQQFLTDRVMAAIQGSKPRSSSEAVAHNITRSSSEAVAHNITRSSSEAVAQTNVLDLFAGIGTYSFPMAAQAAVTAVEGDKTMVQAMNSAAKRHGVATLLAEHRDLFLRPYTPKELKKYDTVVLNPPRAGAAAQVAELAKSTTQTIVMVSCNPATFARDARVLKDAGFQLHSAHGLDQFVYSGHLEIVAHFVR